jgi:hypothetical protein
MHTSALASWAVVVCHVEPLAVAFALSSSCNHPTHTPSRVNPCPSNPIQVEDMTSLSNIRLNIHMDPFCEKDKQAHAM